MRVTFLTFASLPFTTEGTASVQGFGEGAQTVVPDFTQYSTSCGCAVCPCGATSSKPVCIDGVCHNLTPKVKRRPFSRKQEVRFYSETPRNGLRERWRDRRERRAFQTYEAPNQAIYSSTPVYNTQAYNTPVYNTPVYNTPNAITYSKVRRPKTYHVETKVKRDRWWNRKRPVQCTSATCTSPVVQVIPSGIVIAQPIQPVAMNTSSIDTPAIGSNGIFTVTNSTSSAIETPSLSQLSLNVSVPDLGYNAGNSTLSN